MTSVPETDNAALADRRCRERPTDSAVAFLVQG
jgi:hypothetical protein